MATHSSISCLKNWMDRGAWRVTVHGVAKSPTQLSTHAHTYPVNINFPYPSPSSPWQPSSYFSPYESDYARYLMGFPGSSAAAAKLLQSCPTLCDPVDGSPPGSPVPGILQARTLEWVAISFSSAWKWKVKVKSLSCVWLLVTPWTAAYQAPLSMGFSRQKYWSGVPLPSPPWWFSSK